MSDRSPEVTCVVDHGIADVRLARPGRRNALNLSMFQALVDTARALRARPDVRAVVLSGEGPVFCAGLDRALFGSILAGDGAFRDLLDAPTTGSTAAAALGQESVRVWADLPVPVIAAVHGAALGGGLQLALGADIRICAPDARLSVFEVNWGLVPDMTGTQVLPELVGRDVAMEVTLTGRDVSGAEAAELGLVTRLAAPPYDAAMTLAAQIARHPAAAVRESKALLNQGGRVDLAEGLRAEQDALRRVLADDETRALIRGRLDG
jgi:enoyl-CoA hydratase/carnithine racemase